MPKDILNNWKKSRIKVFQRTSLLTLAILAILVGLGFLIDYLLQSGNIAKFTLLVIGFPITQYFVFKNIKSFSKSL